MAISFPDPTGNNPDTGVPWANGDTFDADNGVTYIFNDDGTNPPYWSVEGTGGGGGGTPNLQAVTDEGNTTTNAATFGGDIQVGGNPTNAAAPGTLIDNAGSITINRAGGGNTVFRTFQDSTNTITSQITASGNATFGIGQVQCRAEGTGGAVTVRQDTDNNAAFAVLQGGDTNADSTILFNGNGAAQFLGRVTCRRATDTDAGLAVQNSTGDNQHIFFGNGQAQFHGGDTSIDVNGGVSTRQNIVFENGGNGLRFPAVNTGNADPNTLDDYEEGTWTPQPRLGGTSHIMTGTFQGSYTKIGNFVEARFLLAWTALGTSTGDVTIENLPFASQDVFTCNSGFGDIHRVNFDSTVGQLFMRVQGTVISLMFPGLSNTNAVSMQESDLTNVCNLRGAVSYRTNV